MEVSWFAGPIYIIWSHPLPFPSILHLRHFEFTSFSSPIFCIFCSSAGNTTLLPLHFCLVFLLIIPAFFLQEVLSDTLQLSQMLLPYVAQPCIKIACVLICVTHKTESILRAVPVPYCPYSPSIYNVPGT